MDDFIIFVKKLWDGIEHTVSILANILGILGFFGISHKKVKPLILIVSKRFKIFVYKIKKYIIYKNREIKTILYMFFSNIMKVINNLIISLKMFFHPLIYCFLLLGAILVFDPFSYIDRICNIEVITENDDLNQNIFDSNNKYIASDNVNNYSNKNTIKQQVKDKFKLEYPEGYPKIDDSELEKLCDSIFYVDKNNIDEIIKNEINEWINSYMSNIPLDNAFTSQYKNSYYYSEIEKGFFSEHIDTISSDLLDEVIEGRTELFEAYPNKTLAWLLANSYQMYAFNYLKQTNEPDSILYLYMKSIYYVKKSLEFEMDIDTKEMQIKYIQMRYKDIADCDVLNNEIRVRAYEIYDAINNALGILNMDLPSDDVEE